TGDAQLSEPKELRDTLPQSKFQYLQCHVVRMDQRWFTYLQLMNPGSVGDAAMHRMILACPVKWGVNATSRLTEVGATNVKIAVSAHTTPTFKTFAGERRLQRVILKFKID
ncbi:5525_t:CDS:2, partial [Acaulospora colombiana]